MKRVLAPFTFAVFAVVVATASVGFSAAIPLPDPAKPTCTPTAEQISTVLLNSADELAQLRKNYLYQAVKVTCEKIDLSRTHFEITFSTCGNCLPRTATLVVDQDRTPEHRDGATVYVKTIR